MGGKAARLTREGTGIQELGMMVTASFPAYEALVRACAGEDAGEVQVCAALATVEATHALVKVMSDQNVLMHAVLEELRLQRGRH